MVKCGYAHNLASVSDFTIHCNGRYNTKTTKNNSNLQQKSQNICDFIEIKYEYEGVVATEIARLIAIFQFTPLRNGHSGNAENSKLPEQFFLMICWMTKSIKNESILPYPSYKYNHWYKQAIIF